MRNKSLTSKTEIYQTRSKVVKPSVMKCTANKFQWNVAGLQFPLKLMENEVIFCSVSKLLLELSLALHPCYCDLKTSNYRWHKQSNRTDLCFNPTMPITIQLSMCQFNSLWCRIKNILISEYLFCYINAIYNFIQFSYSFGTNLIKIKKK